MANIPKRVLERFYSQIPKFRRILNNAYDRDINEADTVTIVSDMLCDLFGFDKYNEITSEYAIRSTYCDLAVKIDDDVKYLIEVKSINTDLKEPHLRQAVDYGAHEGIKWIVLTNGYIWQVYSIQLKKTVQHDKVFEINFDEINPRKSEDQELLFLLAKEGLTKDVISDYQERVKAVNRYVISSLLLNEPLLNCIRREIRKLTPGVKVEISEIEDILRNEILKRNVIEDQKAIEAQKKVKRFSSRQEKKKQ